MNDKKEFFQLPENLPNRDQLIDLILQTGATVVDEESWGNFQYASSTILDEIPVAVCILNFSKTKETLELLHHSGIDNLQYFLTQNPETLVDLKNAIQLEKINQIGCQLFGTVNLEHSRQLLGNILFGKSDLLLKGFLQALWDNQSTFTLTGNMHPISGTTRQVILACKEISAPGLSFEQILLLIIDISSQQAILQKQQFQEKLYQAIIESNSDYAFAVSISTAGAYKVELISDSISNSFGYAADEIIKPEILRSSIYPEDYPVFQEAIKKIFLGQAVTFEIRIMTKTGKVHWIQAATRPVKTGLADQAMMIVGAVQDITERKEAEITHRKTQLQLHIKVKELEARTREITLLTTMTNNLQLCQTSSEAFEIVAESAENLFPHFSGAVYFRPPGSHYYQQSAFWGQQTARQDFSREDCWAIRRSAPFLVKAHEKTLRCNHASNIPSEVSSLCMPVIQQGDAIGLFYLESTNPRFEIDQTTIRILASIAEQFGLAMTNIHLRESLAEQALHDPLTGLYNRYYMEEFLEKELHRARRSGKPVSLIMIDMDHFRDLNSLFGHPNVDLALEQVGHLLANSIRAGDVACRYGGDEFLLILPEATTEVAFSRANNLCQAVHSVVVRSESRPPQPISFSVGIASFPVHGMTVAELLQAADSAVFLSKNQGRDRVEIAS